MNNDLYRDGALRIRSINDQMIVLRDNIKNTLISISAGAIIFSTGIARAFTNVDFTIYVLIISWALLLLCIAFSIISKYNTLELLHRMRIDLLKQTQSGQYATTMLNPTKFEKLIEKSMYSSFFLGLLGIAVYTIMNIST